MTLRQILKKASDQKMLDVDEVTKILMITDPEAQSEVFKVARDLRKRYFDDAIFSYGFVYFSTYCKNKCSFCYYRNGNNEAPRYRKGALEIVALASKLAKSGVHLIDLTMGEDPYFAKHPEKLVAIVQDVYDRTQLPIMISPGVVGQDTLVDMKKAGAIWYALYQETYDRELFGRMRYDQSYQERLKLKKDAKELGFLVEEGLMTGFGDSINQRAEAIVSMRKANPSQVRTMTFVPQKGTPLEQTRISDNHNELLMIAAMRLCYPDKLIPASLDVEGLTGLYQRLDAGANVITSLIPAQEGLAGVSQSELDIDDGRRSLAQVQAIVNDCGLRLASHQEYQRFIAKEQAEAITTQAAV